MGVSNIFLFWINIFWKLLDLLSPLFEVTFNTFSKTMQFKVKNAMIVSPWVNWVKNISMKIKVLF